jgi:DNA-binding NarL/FixJ family response regulator/lambda repressor-like predicted transcriptional regulator
VPSIKILVVDDFEGFRRFVCAALRGRGDSQISEVSDGLEALRKVQESRPDLVLLDIGLPGLNGIEAGRRIREVSPNSKILYLSQESSDDVVQEALELGALGYVWKSDAAQELLVAVEAVLRGERFVSRRFAVFSSGDISEERADTALPLPRELQKWETNRIHEVVRYRNDASFVNGFANFIETALQIGNPVIVVANESHRSDVLTNLEARGWDLSAAVRDGSYTSLDVSETLATFMFNDWPNAVQLTKVIGNLVTEAAKAAKSEHSRVAVCGECAPTLLAQGKAEAAIAVEHLFDDLARRYGLQVLCGYVLNDSHIEKDNRTFDRICAEHSAAHFL